MVPAEYSGWKNAELKKKKDRHCCSVRCLKAPMHMFTFFYWVSKHNLMTSTLISSVFSLPSQVKDIYMITFVGKRKRLSGLAIYVHSNLVINLICINTHLIEHACIKTIIRSLNGLQELSVNVRGHKYILDFNSGSF